MQELIDMATKIAKEIKDIESGRAIVDSKGNIVGYNWEEK
jgi:tRNA(Arg) A34 adenosine deaminase TadA